MKSKEPDENEKLRTGGGGFNALAGIFILGMVCCAAGPVAVLVGVAGIKAWFNGLHPFLIAAFMLASAVLAIIWVTRKRRRGSQASSDTIGHDATDDFIEKTTASTRANPNNKYPGILRPSKR